MILTGPALDAAIANIKLEEGYRSLMYKDSTGNWTIGYGHNLSVKPLSQAVCALILSEDLEEAEHDLASAFPYYLHLDGARQGILLDLAFNLGIEGLMGFRKMLVAIQLSDWTIAADELRNSKAAVEEPNRIAKLAHALETGVF